MTLYSFESGSDGNALTVGPGLTGFDTAAMTQTSTGEIDTAWKVDGTRSARFVGLFNGTNGTCYIERNLPNTKTTFRFVIAIHPENTASAESGFLSVLNGSTRGWSVGLQSTNRLIVRDGGGAGGANAWNPTEVIAANNTNDYFLRGVVTQSGTTGTMEFELWKEGDSTATATSGVLTSKNTGASAYNRVRVGARTGTGSSVLTLGIDYLLIDETTDNANTAMLPLPWQASPTIVLDQPVPNVVNLTDSTAGSGSLTYLDPTLVSGPALSWFEVVEGVFAFQQDTGAIDSVYTFTVQQTDTQTDAENATIEPGGYSVINITAPRIPSAAPPASTWE